MQPNIQFLSIAYAEPTRSQEAPTVDNRRRYPEPDAWWQSMPGALAWLMDLFIEGFAAYGAAMSAGYFQQVDMDAEQRGEVAEASRSDDPTHHCRQLEDELAIKWREEDLDGLLKIERP